MEIQSFNSEIEFDENRIKTKVIVETSFSKEIRIALLQGQLMKEHKTPYPILIHLLQGVIELGLYEKAYLMQAGDIIALNADTPHNLLALENSIIRLTLSKHDKVERVNNVIND